MLLVTMTLSAFALGSVEVNQGRAAARPAVIEQMMNCRAITEPASRLSCLETALNAFEAAEHDGKITVVDRVAAAENSRRDFGLRLPSIPLLTAADVDSVENLSSTLISANQSSSGKWIFSLADGSTWRQSDSQTVRAVPRSGTEATIRRAAMNSFLLNLGSGRSIRVERVQ